MANDLYRSDGRLCNHILRALAGSFLAKQGNIAFHYGEYFPQMKRLGIPLFTEGTKTYQYTQRFTDRTFFFPIQLSSVLCYNIDLTQCFCQTKSFSNYLYHYFQQSKHHQSIVNANLFRDRYHTNQDVFVHVRLGDVEEHNPGIAYYQKALSSIPFQHGYISSDDISHPICQQLIQTYHLDIIDKEEVETIMFGSTCRYVLLTGGSFSYIIGLFAFFSRVYYLKGQDLWYPSELFHIDDWTEVDLVE